jgi:hypothetical protein
MTLLIALLATIGAGTAGAERPSEIKYLICVAGQYSGHNTSKIKESSGVLTIDTVTELAFLDFTLNFTSRTQVDAETMEPIYFSWEGEKGGVQWSGTVAFDDGDVAVGEVTMDGEIFPSSKTIEGLKFFFENYVTAHQMLIMDRIDNSDKTRLRAPLFMPSDYIVSKATIESATELEWQATNKPLYAKRFVWALENSDPFYAIYDPDRRIPVYLDYPATRTEVFLASDYPEKPVTKYALTEEERDAMGNN